MKSTLILSLISVGILTCHKRNDPSVEPQKALSIERLYEAPNLNGQMPKGVQVSPDGKKITFLKEKETNIKILDLWEFDIKTGEQKLLVDSQALLGGKEEKLSDEEIARRERMRISSQGIVSYQWSKQGDKLLFPIAGDLYVYLLNHKNPVKRITNTKSFEIDPRFSPLGTYISFVRDSNVFAVNLKNMKEVQITKAGTKENPMGVAEFIAQEEMARYRGYWWSPDENFLAVTKVNNDSVEKVKRFEVYADKMSIVEQQYPKAGKSNAIVELGVFSLNSKRKPSWVGIAEKDYYIPNVKWLPNSHGKKLSYTIQSRDQKNLSFYIYNVDSRKSKKLFEEGDKAWVNVRHDFIFLKKKKKLLWVSDKNGVPHIYLYDLENGEERSLTSGDWFVDKLISVDEESGSVFFNGYHESPLERHLYKVSLIQDHNPVKISKESGSHSIVMSDTSQFYLDYYSNSEMPTSLSVHGVDGVRLYYIEKNDVDKDHPLFTYQADFGVWEYGEVKRTEGENLFYKILKPKHFNPNKKYPVIQYVYGGPGVQLVKNSWAGRDLFQQVLSQQGFVVIVGDNRGTPGRGRDFERSYYKKFGDIEVKDQSFLIKSLLEKNSYMDESRVGVYGHSYGGYLTMMLLMQSPETYHVGVSGAPVVDWSYYDTHYTERYLGKPSEDADVYKKSNVLTYTDKLKGKLLVVHGMADDNVLYNHSLILYQDLQKKMKLFDIMAYPGAKHGIRREKEWSIHYKKSLLNYFKTHLMER